MNKYISGIFLIGALALVGAGCINPAEENTNSETTTSAVEETTVETTAVETETEESSDQVVQVEEEVKETQAEAENDSTDEVDTSDWLTYTNEEYGYSIQYPSDWNAGYSVLEGGLFISQTPTEPTDQQLYLDVVEKNAEGIELLDWYNAPENQPAGYERGVRKNEPEITFLNELVALLVDYGNNQTYYIKIDDRIVLLQSGAWENKVVITMIDTLSF